MKTHECEYCNGEIRERNVTVNHWYEDKLVIIKNVPVRVCHQCGERYYEAAILDQLDTLAQNSETAQENISVPIMVLDT